MADWIGVLTLHCAECLVIFADVAHELSLQIRDGREHTAGDDFAPDLAETQLYLV